MDTRPAMTPTDTSDTSDETDAPEHTYSYRPSLLGAQWELTLGREALSFSAGPAGLRSGRVPYARIARLRMAFRPMSMQTTRYMTELWAPGEPPLRIVSTSWRSMVEQQRLDAAYSRFVADLHSRIAAAGNDLVCERGRPPLVYWPGLAVFIGVSLGLALLIVRALQAQAWVPALFVGGFFALFVWQGGAFFSRNRPGTYPVAKPPRELLPG